MPHPVTWLADAVARDGSRPAVTWYDDATGERVELSGATLLTWVAKTAHFLSADLGVGPGSAVSVDLPRHWTAALWWLAVDAVGGARESSDHDDLDVAVIGPQRLDDLPAAQEVVAVSMAPMGAPFDATLPDLVHDFAVAVRGQPDHFGFAAAPESDAGRRDAQAAVELAQAWGLGPKDRILAVGPWAAPDPAVPELFTALSADASVVWVRNPKHPGSVEHVESERVTAVLNTRTGQPVASGIRVLTSPSVSFGRPSPPS
ncbi:MAG: TIGR03089 family protein [Actinomycetes bacterium]